MHVITIAIGFSFLCDYVKNFSFNIMHVTQKFWHGLGYTRLLWLDIELFALYT